jgi:DNA polymerase-4
MTRWIFHVDMDEFIAAVEVLRHPELRGSPVIVGGDGDPTKRGVVSTASYEAREFGVRSGMPLRTALKRCPDGVFLGVDADHYLEASNRVMETLRSFPAVVQTLGWDEAFMAVETDDPEALARGVQRAVLERTDLWCSIGVGDSKHRAKLASAFAKPRGVFRLTREEWPALMGQQPVEALWGIGKKTAAKLNELGIHSVDELANTDDDVLAGRFGPNTGPWIRGLGTGEDDGEVTAEPYVPRGRSHERTFQRDLTDPDGIRRETERIARELVDDLPDGRLVIRVIVKVRFTSFFTSTHGMKLAEATTDPERIAEAALDALDRFEMTRPVRLLGVRAEFADPSITGPDPRHPGHRGTAG